MQIPPLRLTPKDLQIPRPLKPQPWEKLSRPTYWFGDRLLTKKGWGVCTGIKQISTRDWLYYIDLDNEFESRPFAEIEILEQHNIRD